MSVQGQADGWGVELLAEFMNAAAFDATEAEWGKFTSKEESVLNSGYRLDRMSLQDAIDTRFEIHEALGFLRIDKRVLKKNVNPYIELTQLLSEVQMPTNYQCMALKKGRTIRQGQTILHSHDKRRWVAIFWPIAHGPRERIFTLLAGTLINGTFNKLKVCRHCGNYFAANDLKRDFCPGKNCKIDYFNRLKIEARRGQNKPRGKL